MAIGESDYVRKLDSLARFYNSQATAHVGYLLTSIVIYCAVFNLLQPTAALTALLSYFGLELDPFEASIIVALIFFTLLPIWIWLPFSFRYQLARTQFYMELSQITWEHMGVNRPAGVQLLWKRATDEGMSIQEAVIGLFEARLYRSLWVKEGRPEPPKEDNGQSWMHVFRLEENLFFHAIQDYEKLVKSDDYSNLLPTYKKERKILRIWKYVDLLWTAHSRTIRSYGEADQRYKLFKRFLDR